MRPLLPSRRWRRTGTASAVLLLLAAPTLFPFAVSAEETEDPFIRRVQVERRREELLAELEELEATDAEIQAVLAQLAADIEAQTQVVEAARLGLVAAIRAAERAAEAEASKAQEVRELEQRMREMAVQTYVTPPSEQRLSMMLQGGDLNDLSKAMVYFDAKFGLDVRIAADLERARQELTVRRRAAREAVVHASARSDEVAAQLTALEATKATHQQFADAVRSRMGEVDWESAAIYAESLELDAEIERRKAEILAAANRGVIQGPVPLVEVRGIQIHVSLATALESMLAAAEDDGIKLGGGGYRSHEAQIATRRNNCGDDPYSVWEKPPGECSPPTARPGTSMHEIGMAVDFTYNGSIISTRSSPAFVWLAANAAIYGFYNLPSEPWHWSANGN